MPTVKLPDVQLPDGKLEDKIAYLTDIVQQYKKSLEYFINNLDSENISSIDGSVIKNLTIGVAQITDSLTVGVNVDSGDSLTPLEQAIADKRRVFTVTPYPPYEIGDMWTDESNLKVCVVTKLSGVYVSTDFRLATNYTNPTGVTTIVDGIITTDYLNAVGISADAINGGTITGVYIDVSADVTIGDNLYLGDPADDNINKSIIFHTGSLIISNPNIGLGAIQISAPVTEITDGYVNIGDGGYTVTCGGEWDFSSATVTGITAKFG